MSGKGLLKVLFVEDRADDVDLVVLRLREHGYQVEPKRVDTAAEFSAALADQSFDLVLSDYTMPSFSAPEALKILKHSRTDLPFVVVSGSIGEERAVDIVRRGASGYVLKDNLLPLENVIDQALRETEERRKRRRAEQELAQLNLHLEERVQERTRQLEDALTQMEALSYGLAHDLKSPIRSVAMRAQLLCAEHAQALPADAREDLERIAKDAGRLGTFVDEVLEYGRMARRAPTLESLDLDQAVTEALGTFQEAIAESGGSVEVRGPLGRVRADRLLLGQALGNLISNALKFVRPGTAPRVEIGARPKSGMIRLWVSDDGIGIPAEHRARVFEIFERLHSQDEYPGSGVGLAVVRRAAERMGGKAGVECKPGGGSCFWLDLPA